MTMTLIPVFSRYQSTVCHEIGHGLGLGHTDELYNNTDLGNCMDYTNKPENNKTPDDSNFETLRKMYGTLQDNGGRMLRGSGRRDSFKAIPDDIYFQIERARLEMDNVLSNTDETVRALESKASDSRAWNLGNGYKLHIKALLV